jgi:hypothetical protein
VKFQKAWPPLLCKAEREMFVQRFGVIDENVFVVVKDHQWNEKITVKKNTLFCCLSRSSTDGRGLAGII